MEKRKKLLRHNFKIPFIFIDNLAAHIMPQTVSRYLKNCESKQFFRKPVFFQQKLATVSTFKICLIKGFFNSELTFLSFIKYIHNIAQNLCKQAPTYISLVQFKSIQISYFESNFRQLNKYQINASSTVKKEHQTLTIHYP